MYSCHGKVSNIAKISTVQENIRNSEQRIKDLEGQVMIVEDAVNTALERARYHLHILRAVKKRV